MVAMTLRMHQSFGFARRWNNSSLHVGTCFRSSNVGAPDRQRCFTCTSCVFVDRCLKGSVVYSRDNFDIMAGRTPGGMASDPGRPCCRNPVREGEGSGNEHGAFGGSEWNGFGCLCWLLISACAALTRAVADAVTCQVL